MIYFFNVEKEEKQTPSTNTINHVPNFYYIYSFSDNYLIQVQKQNCMYADKTLIYSYCHTSGIFQVVFKMQKYKYFV